MILLETVLSEKRSRRSFVQAAVTTHVNVYSGGALKWPPVIITGEKQELG